MIKIAYPNSKPKLKVAHGREQVFCIVRKKWVVLTPEEWVRQNFLLYLTEALGYALPLIAVERLVKVGTLSQRFDIVVFTKDSLPFMIVECKAMDVPLSAATVQQALRYNAEIAAPFLVLTNGLHGILYQIKDGAIEERQEMPTMP